VNAATQKNKNTAVILALFLGGLGIHKFYLGRPVMGIVYLVFCWTFVPAAIAFIEGIWYATMSDALFQERVRVVRL
jgi:TM2 domain-containing membrane protein YozV